MKISLYTLTSPLHDENAVNSASAAFLKEIEKRLGFQMDFRGYDFSGYGSGGLDVIFVRTGGTEGLFKEVFPELGGNILLLTSGKSNSLAASMEILSYLNQQGRKGEIIHGSPDYIAERLGLLSKICKDYFLKSPIGNHHVVFTGSHVDLFDAFCETVLETA